jgi:hypothetical protein
VMEHDTLRSVRAKLQKGRGQASMEMLENRSNSRSDTGANS